MQQEARRRGTVSSDITDGPELSRQGLRERFSSTDELQFSETLLEPRQAGFEKDHFKGPRSPPGVVSEGTSVPSYCF